MPNTFFMVACGAGLNLVNLLVHRVPMDGIIGLECGSAEPPSDYVPMAQWARQHGIPYYPVTDYAMKSEETERLFSGVDIDILVVAGWQRLIPAWLIRKCGIGALGCHGSPWGITRGRGRSPQNWALLMGEKTFRFSVFFIEPGVDDGAVLETRDIAYDETDDIATSYIKVGAAFAEIIESLLAPGHTDRAQFRAIPQVGEPFYLPRRTAEDGQIDWRWSTRDILRQVRALTSPYPGAWTWLRAGGEKLYLWSAGDASYFPCAGRAPGEILEVYPNIPAFAVKTGDGALLARCWGSAPDRQADAGLCSPASLEKGKAFASADGYALLQGVFQRFARQYPDRRLNPHLLRWAEDHKPR